MGRWIHAKSTFLWAERFVIEIFIQTEIFCWYFIRKVYRFRQSPTS
jgi:hypothetical protein